MNYEKQFRNINKKYQGNEKIPHSIVVEEIAQTIAQADQEIFDLHLEVSALKKTLEESNKALGVFEISTILFGVVCALLMFGKF